MENNSAVNFKVETIDEDIGFEKGLIVGQMEDNPGIVLTTTLNYAFLTIINIKDPKENLNLR
jgi:hypothetical protein